VSVYDGATILVTGGTGSIGSEIVRQLLQHNPKTVRILSRDETAQHELAHELVSKQDRIRFLIGDVRDRQRLRRAMHGVDLVFHAAALKHVPACEYNAFEAVETNVRGTQNIINAALDAGVKKVLLISTDKAVNPVSVMGATKLLAEKLITSANRWASTTQFACVRFGNVTGSRGSLVPTVKRQIARGGPVTVTDPCMTRYCISIECAGKACLEAMRVTGAGDIYVPDMLCLNIMDIIDDAMVASGKDVPVVTTGIRPGEKLHEELFGPGEEGRSEHFDAGYTLVHGKGE